MQEPSKEAIDSVAKLLAVAADRMYRREHRQRHLHPGAFGSIKQPCKPKVSSDERKAKRKAARKARKKQRAK